MASGDAWHTFRCRRVVAEAVNIMGKCFDQLPVKLVSPEDEALALKVERYKLNDSTASPQLFMEGMRMFIQ